MMPRLFPDEPIMAGERREALARALITVGRLLSRDVSVRFYPSGADGVVCMDVTWSDGYVTSAPIFGRSPLFHRQTVQAVDMVLDELEG